LPESAEKRGLIFDIKLLDRIDKIPGAFIKRWYLTIALPGGVSLTHPEGRPLWFGFQAVTGHELAHALSEFIGLLVLW
jgi:hypothetical protein